MKFRIVHISRRGYYALCTDEATNACVLEVLVTLGAWYSRYFRLSKDEFEGYPENRTEIDLLARSCAGAAGIQNNRERFIYSQKPEENRVTPAPLPLLPPVRASSLLPSHQRW